MVAYLRLRAEREDRTLSKVVVRALERDIAAHASRFVDPGVDYNVTIDPIIDETAEGE
jgi:hypothetical protein